MADPRKRVADNAPGNFFVDTSCIDCKTCRWLAPGSFDAGHGTSKVFRQPGDAEAEQGALRALISCPVGAIGTMEKADLRAVVTGFPDAVEEDVFYCGYHSSASFGAARASSD